jgi:hypothetical protein
MINYRKNGLILLFVLLLTSTMSVADVILTAEDLNSSLKGMQRLLRELQNEEAQDRNIILYQLGVEADSLAKLLTDEVVAHGPQNEGLISLALDRTEKMGVDISWYGVNQSFYYDGKAFEQYLKASPQGQHVADSLFRQMKRNFYLVGGGSARDLIDGSNEKQQFINTFPEFEEIHEVELFLAIDLRDLWRHYHESNESEAALRLEQRVRTQFQRIMDRYQNLEAADIATRLLARFEEELKQWGQDSP